MPTTLKEQILTNNGGRASAAEQEQKEVPRFRPMNRPPMAVLGIVDDGGETAEWVRIRTPRFTIGRVEGDVQIPHDPAMSSQHLEIALILSNGRPTWRLRDLGSRNGTFVRATSALLRSGQEFLLGTQRFKLLLGTSVAAPEPFPNPQRRSTMGWQQMSVVAPPAPRLVRVTPAGELPCLELDAGEALLGSDATKCRAAITDDPLVSPVHARLKCDPKGRWQIENVDSVNGVWIRIEDLPVEGYCEFLAGEQRFVLRIPGHEHPIAR